MSGVDELLALVDREKMLSFFYKEATNLQHLIRETKIGDILVNDVYRRNREGEEESIAIKHLLGHIRGILFIEIDKERKTNENNK